MVCYSIVSLCVLSLECNEWKGCTVQDWNGRDVTETGMYRINNIKWSDFIHVYCLQALFDQYVVNHNPVVNGLQ